ncbi:MAG: glutathione S-transferase family protein, partial [Pseudomonadota bacterium]|nr:glutathione S-transferase family protein [Pseudomonadota bacterium]
DTFEQGGDLYLLTGLPHIAAWRMELARRPSVQGAVHDDFAERLHVFMCARQSVLGERFRRMSPPPA